ncbi:hypothetical protein ACP70R_011287 [Stipagrostis hirtigluma subsp. patula]
MGCTEYEGYVGNKKDEDGHHNKQDDEKARLEEYKKVVNLKAALRQSNLNPERPDDMFAELRPTMTRHSSIQELNDALVELEENERVTLAEKGGKETHSYNESLLTQSENVAFDANIKRSPNRPEKHCRDHEEVGRSESSSDDRTRYWEDEEDFLYEERSDNRSENEDNNEGIDVPVGSDEDGSVEVRQMLVRADPKEQEDFDRELKALLQESLESRKLKPRARPTVNMKMPMNALQGLKYSTDTEAADEENVYDDTSTSRGFSRVCVKVLMKKGNKPQMKQMLIPGGCSLAHSTKQQDAAELEEKQDIKRKILEYSEREEEESNGGLLQAENWGQKERSLCSSMNLTGHDSWDRRNRGGGFRQRYYIAGGSYRGYGRR